MKFSINYASKIKLIIWDLDDTFWEGTLSDNSCKIKIIKKNIDLIHNLSKRGIINSICSKNDRETVEYVLNQNEILDYFVFTSINWETKGKRIKKIIDDMSFRPENVLFIDDNLSNLGEAEFLMPDLMVAKPDCIPTLIELSNILIT